MFFIIMQSILVAIEVKVSFILGLTRFGYTILYLHLAAITSLLLFGPKYLWLSLVLIFANLLVIGLLQHLIKKWVSQGGDLKKLIREHIRNSTKR